jgi:hypothetical protein
MNLIYDFCSLFEFSAFFSLNTHTISRKKEENWKEQFNWQHENPHSNSNFFSIRQESFLHDQTMIYG